MREQPKIGYSNGKPVPPNNLASAKAPGKPGILPALRRLFKEQPDLPSQAALLGVCEDNFPVLLNLNDPTPGALLIIGDERQEQLDLLRTLVSSVALRNTPRSLQLMIVSYDPQSWKDWIAEQGWERYCLGIEGLENGEMPRDWILRLGDWTEERRMGQRSGPPILLIMDTLSFMPRLVYDVRLNFEWLAKEGPAAQIWPVAAISTDLAQLLNGRHMLRAFHTHILGYAKDTAFYASLAGVSEKDISSFPGPGQFTVHVGDAWMRFQIPGRS